MSMMNVPFVSTIKKAPLSGKRAKFLSTYLYHQPWSIPDSIIYYMAMNPNSAKVYEKLINQCKYFFVQNPIIPIYVLLLHQQNNKWDFWYKGKRINLRKTLSKLWIAELEISKLNPTVHVSLSSIFLKIYQIKKIIFRSQDISYNDFVFVTSKRCESITFNRSTIFNEDGSLVPIEKIFALLPSVKDFHYCFNNIYPNVITSKTIPELLKIPHFYNLKSFTLDNIPIAFDFDQIFEYIKKNKKTKLFFMFYRELPGEYIARLQKIVDEIIAAGNRDYKSPYIGFLGLDRASQKKLLELTDM